MKAAQGKHRNLPIPIRCVVLQLVRKQKKRC